MGQPSQTRSKWQRSGKEVACATSIVRYKPHSSFSSYVHTSGEEILVIDGVFGDEYGPYPAGTYLRNPIGTVHRPRIKSEGVTLFLKLHQFDPKDLHQCAGSILAQPWQFETVAGLSIMSLHKFHARYVALVRWDPNMPFN